MSKNSFVCSLNILIDWLKSIIFSISRSVVFTWNKCETFVVIVQTFLLYLYICTHNLSKQHSAQYVYEFRVYNINILGKCITTFFYSKFPDFNNLI